LWLKDGRMAGYGAAGSVTQAYLAYHEEKSAGAKVAVAPAAAATAGIYAITALAVDPAGAIGHGATLTVRGEAYTPDGRAPVVLVGIVRADGTPVYGVATDMDAVAPRRVAADRYAFELVLPDLPLLPGKYLVRAHALDPEGVRLFDHVECAIVIEGETRELGLVRLAHHWRDPSP
jgi:lipopolysaccharide transport system ATP-binding protein